MGNTIPQGVSSSVTETAPELDMPREGHDKAQASIHEDAQAKLSRLNQEYLQSLDNLIEQLKLRVDVNLPFSRRRWLLESVLTAPKDPVRLSPLPQALSRTSS
jgi:hypothetical protein